MLVSILAVLVYLPLLLPTAYGSICHSYVVSVVMNREN